MLSLISPFINSIFPFIWLYVHNQDQLAWQDVLGSIPMVLLFILCVWLLAQAIYKDQLKSSALTAIFVLFFFAYNHINYGISRIMEIINLPTNWSQAVLSSNLAWLRLLMWGFLFLIFAYLITKDKFNLKITNQVFLLIGVSSIISVGFIWVQQEIAQPQNKVEQFIAQWKNEVLSSTIINTAIETKPDIYYIILDGMGREDILNEKYQLELKGQIVAFEQLGFHVADKSTSNYAKTDLSLASSLNMMYIQEVAELIDEDATSKRPLEIMIEKNLLFENLKKIGYKTATFTDEYSITDITSVDYYLKPGLFSTNGFQNVLINTTPINDIATLFSTRDLYDQHRMKIQFAFEELVELSKNPQPTVILAHILAPHPPFVFDAHGSPVQPDRDFTLDDGNDFIEAASREEYISGYRDQAEYILSKTYQTVEQIIANSSSPVIIIIQGDHGPRSKMNWGDNKKPDLKEGMSIFNAYFFPDQDYRLLHENITPINSFRIVLNQYLKTNLELLADHNYIQPDDRTYHFKDVTERLMGD